MKQFLIITICFSLSGCCGLFHDKDTFEIKDKDKTWFPYKSKSNIVYITSSGTLDSLTVIEIDTANRERGTECVEIDEYRNCKIQSNKFNDFQVQIDLDHITLDFEVSLSEKTSNFYYCYTCKNVSNNPHDIRLNDSIIIDNIVYRDVLNISDTINNFEINYNRLGIIRYIIEKDTFNLRE